MGAKERNVKLNLFSFLWFFWWLEFLHAYFFWYAWFMHTKSCDPPKKQQKNNNKTTKKQNNNNPTTKKQKKHNKKQTQNTKTNGTKQWKLVSTIVSIVRA